MHQSRLIVSVCENSWFALHLVVRFSPVNFFPHSHPAYHLFWLPPDLKMSCPEVPRRRDPKSPFLLMWIDLDWILPWIQPFKTQKSKKSWQIFHHVWPTKVNRPTCMSCLKLFIMTTPLFIVALQWPSPHFWQARALKDFLNTSASATFFILLELHMEKCRLYFK